MHHRPTPARHRFTFRELKLAPVPPILPPGPVDQAQRVVLRKIHHRLPEFLNGWVRSRASPDARLRWASASWHFQVAFTVPHGLVEATDSTIIEFIE